MENTIVLYFDITINCGTAETKPAKVAPAPIVTSSAGKAQQTIVLRLVNKLINGSTDVFLMALFILPTYCIPVDSLHVIARIYN